MGHSFWQPTLTLNEKQVTREAGLLSQPGLAYESRCWFYPFPVIWRELPDEVLRHQLLQELGDAGEIGLVVLKLHPVDESCQLQDLFPCALVVATQVLW